jgi:TadE-like protein
MTMPPTSFFKSASGPEEVLSRRNIGSSYRSNVDCERGSTTVEFLVTVPLVFSLIFGAIQLGIAWHGHVVLAAAAQRALRAESTRAANVETETAAQAVAATVARDAATIQHAQAIVTNDGTTITVVVSGDITGPFPGLTLHMRQSASGPSERFRPLCETAC